MLSKLGTEIRNISERPGMYVGPGGVWNAEERLEDIANYINGMIHGLSFFSNVSLASWRGWVKSHYQVHTEPLWHKILLSEFRSVEAVLESLPALFSEYENDQK